MTHGEGEAELLAAGAAHDIANALSAVLGWVQVAREGGDVGQALESIEEAARAARDTARLLLGEADDRAADLAAAARTVGRLLAPEAQRRGVVVEVRADSPTYTQLSSAGAFRCLWNLALNAVQHAHRRVRLTVGPDATVRVTDDGPGMDDALQQRLMTTGLTTRPDGHGLGVVIVRRLVETIGGQLTVTSAPGAGATFCLRLPRVHPSRSKALSGVQRRLARRVLVVEDDRGVREMVTTALGLRGIDAVGVATLAEVAALDGPPFDVALVDYTLADANGAEVIRLLRAQERARHIVLASGASEPYLPAEAQPDRWLRKPYDVAQLLTALTTTPADRSATG